MSNQAGSYKSLQHERIEKPFQPTANLTDMRSLPTFKIQSVRSLEENQFMESAEQLVRHLKAPY
ncbi:MAG TPA: hypothetical protein VLQ66_01840 [Paenisporosarcina sp.]|nr:hypothetical protein [Paenisporosarcina sp.]